MFFHCNVGICGLECYVKAENNLFFVVLAAFVYAHARSGVGGCFRVESRILGERKEVVQRTVEAQVVYADFFQPCFGQGVPQLYLFDFEISFSLLSPHL